jgi:hypothetical protein
MEPDPSHALDRIRRARLRAQRLAPRSRSGAAAVVRAVCGIQAQDARAAALSVRARAEGLTAPEVEAARVRERAFVRTWAWRGTLHLVAAEDLAWVLPLVAPGAVRSVRARWRQLGLDDDVYAHAREAILRALTGAGPLTRAEIAERLAAAGIDPSGQRLPHLVGRAALEGLLCHGPERDGEPAYVALRDWIGPLTDARPRGAALAELARRYLAAYGPAEPRDLAAWSGLPAADVRGAWAAVEGELAEVEVAGRVAWTLARDAALPRGEPRAPSVRLLPSFDTYLLGYRTRELSVAAEHAARVWPGGGWIRAVLLVDGRAAGTWRRTGAALAVTPFATLPQAVLPGLEAEVADVGRFLGTPLELTVEPAG